MRRVIVGLFIIVIAAFSRLLPHPPNVTPLVAMALAGGVYFDKKYAFILPILALVVSDIFLGFHATVPFVYGSFLMIVLLGVWLKSHKKVVTVAAGSIASSLFFFVVTNFGVWLTGGGWYYPKTLSGLVECYVLALPFLQNALLGDLAFTAVIFGLFEGVEYYLQSLKKVQTER